MQLTEQQIEWATKMSTCHIIIEKPNLQNKESILRIAKEKFQVKYEGKPIRIMPDFFIEILKGRRSYIDILPTLRDQGCKSSLLYPARLSITIEIETKIFRDKIIFKQYLSTNLAL